MASKVETRKNTKKKDMTGKQEKTSSKSTTANKDKSTNRSKTTKKSITVKQKISTKLQKGGDTCSNGRYRDENGICPDEYGRYDKVVTLKLDITDNQNDKQSPLEQIPEKISKVLLGKNVQLYTKNYHQAAISTEAFEGLNDTDKTTFLTSYKFWEYCFIDTNYMNSSFNVMIMPPSVLLLRGIDATCDAIKAPHTVEDKFQQLPCWFSDIENASIYSKDNGHVWCYTSIRPLILFELTDSKSLQTLYNIIVQKGKKINDEIIKYDTFSTKMKQISSKQSANVETLKNDIIDCFLILPDNTPFLDEALDIIDAIDENIETSKILLTIQTTVNQVNTILQQLKIHKNQQLQKYSNSLDIIKATTGITIDAEKQYSLITGINLKYEQKDTDLWNNKNTINRISYHSFDFKLVEIIKEHIPWCDGYYGRKICSTYHKYFHREVCIFGTHGKMKLMRTINPCKTPNSQNGGNENANTNTYTNNRISDQIPRNTPTFVKNLNGYTNNQRNTPLQRNTNVVPKPNIQSRKMTTPLSFNFDSSVNVDTLSYGYSMVNNSMYYNKLAELHYENVIMDFQKSYLCNPQFVDRSKFEPITLVDANVSNKNS